MYFSDEPARGLQYTQFKLCNQKKNLHAIFIAASGKVENVQLSVKDDSIKVTWQLPQCKGNIGEIKVQYRKKGQSSWQWEVKTPTSSDKEITIKGLDKGSEYEVRVVVIDIKGTVHEMTGAKVARTGTYFHLY